MAQVTLENPGARRSPLDVIVDRIWRFFCSVRAAVFEILVLAVLVLLGTLRGSDAPQWLANALPFTQPAVDRLYGWEVFRSLPFMFTLAILSVAITVCTINRVPGIWKSIANPSIRTTRGFLASNELSATYSTTGTPLESASQLKKSLGGKRFRLLDELHGLDLHIYADKNRYAKFATFPFHLALIMMLIGGIIGGRYGFRENAFVVPEGSMREVGNGTGLVVELERFSDDWREDGIPAEYRSDLVLYKNGEEVKRESITVNNPMTYGSVTFYQSSYGQAAAFRITDKDGNLLFDDSVSLGLFVSTANPDAPAAVQQLPQVGAQIHVIAPDVNPANAPELDDLKLDPGQMFVQVRPLGTAGAPVSAVVDQGETVAIGDLNVEFIRERRFTLLQVASNPGMPVFWAASFLLVGGLAMTFYFPHRRIRGIISSSDDGQTSTVTMAPLARWDWSAKRDFHRIIDQLNTDLGIDATVTENPKVDGSVSQDVREAMTP